MLTRDINYIKQHIHTQTDNETVQHSKTKRQMLGLRYKPISLKLGAMTETTIGRFWLLFSLGYGFRITSPRIKLFCRFISIQLPSAFRQTRWNDWRRSTREWIHYILEAMRRTPHSQSGNLYSNPGFRLGAFSMLKLSRSATETRETPMVVVLATSLALAEVCCLRTHLTIRYDSVYLTCSKKLTGSQLSLPLLSLYTVFQKNVTTVLMISWKYY